MTPALRPPYPSRNVPGAGNHLMPEDGTCALQAEAIVPHDRRLLLTRDLHPAATARVWRFAAVSPGEQSGVEEFIRHSFLDAYGARIAEFMPHLVALFHGNELMAACGLRFAAHERLYLESYLDQPIEARLQTINGLHETRSGMVEVGNLAIARPGAARHFILHLTAYLTRHGYSRVVFTAVPALRNNFLRLRIPIDTLGPASADRLDPLAQQAWGSYFDHAPQVSSVRVDDAVRALASNQ